MTERLHLADADRVESILDRMARQIEAERGSDTVLVGILRRGGPLALALARRLETLPGGALPVGTLKLERYDDDLMVLHDRAAVDESSLDVDVEKRDVILVDDVLYTGETAFRAAETVRGLGARGVRLAVLCRRGSPRMPVHARFVGLQLDVGPGWIVDVAAPPYEDGLGIDIKAQP